METEEIRSPFFVQKNHKDIDFSQNFVIIEKRNGTFRAFLNSVQHAETRIFFRNTALIFLEIHKGFLRQIALSCEKIYVISAY